MSNHSDCLSAFATQLEAIDLCMEKKLILPALSLIYSGMDAAAWIVYGDISVKDRFVKFITEFKGSKPLSNRP
jgi:hypothetical protein